MATNTKLREMGNRIKKRRSELNITQEMLALKLDVTPHYIYEIEAGNKQPRVDKLLKIAKFLETSIDYLVTGDYFINSSIASSVILETSCIAIAFCSFVNCSFSIIFWYVSNFCEYIVSLSNFDFTK